MSLGIETVHSFSVNLCCMWEGEGSKGFIRLHKNNRVISSNYEKKLKYHAQQNEGKALFHTLKLSEHEKTMTLMVCHLLT
jgi:hypothetical protein